MATKIKALQMWCKRMTDGYRDVDVTDFTKSWRSGLAFCALIHRFRPDLIDYDSLSKENVFDNNHLAFTVAEKELDIPAFLEAADMVALQTPDKLSIITYVSQYYNKLGQLPQLGGPGVKGKVSQAPAAAVAGTKRHQKAEPLSEPEPKKQQPSAKPAESQAKVKTLGDKCAICNNKVYLLERHVEDGQLYHRSCYRHSELSPTQKIYTRSPFLSPSLHNVEPPSTPTSKSTSSSVVSSLDQVKDVGKTYLVDNKHGLKSTTKHEDHHKKPDVQKTLFHDKQKNTSTPMEVDKFDTKGSVLASRKDYSKDKPALHIPSKTTPSTDSVLSPTPKFDATKAFEKHSVDFLSSDKELTNSQSTMHKRQLPLIFQNTGSTGDNANNETDKNKVAANGKSSWWSTNNSSGNTLGDKVRHDVDSHAKAPSTKPNSVSKSKATGHGHDSDSKPSVPSTVKVDSQVKSASETKVSEKAAGPVAKPRQGVLGKKVLDSIVPDVILRKVHSVEKSQSGHQRSKSPSSVPKPAPRSSIVGKDGLQTGAKSPEITRKANTNTKPSTRDSSPEPSSPPPLPSSAPPPLVISTPLPGGTHPLPSPRHTDLTALNNDTPKKEKTKETVQLKKTSEHLAESHRPLSAISATPSGTKDTSGKESTVSSRLKSTSSALPSLSGKDTGVNVDKRPAPSRPFATPSTSSSVAKASDRLETVKSNNKPGTTSATVHNKPGTTSATVSHTTSTTSVFTSKSTFSIQSSKHQEEPMDVDTAISKARAKYGEEPMAVMVTPVNSEEKEKSTLTGLLKSLANVRDTPSTASNTSVSSSPSSTSVVTVKSSSVPSVSHSDKSQPQLYTPALVPESEPKKSTASVFVSSKVARLQVKDTDSATKSKISPREAHLSDVTEKSSHTVEKSKHVGDGAKSKDSSQVHSNFKIQHMKIGESITLTVNSTKKEDTIKDSTVSTSDQNTNATSGMSSWKKELAAMYADGTGPTGDHNGSSNVTVPARRDRSKSDADVLHVGRTTPSLPKHKDAAPYVVEPPPFLQVKLKESNNTTPERKARSNSTGTELETVAETKSEWQLEAERRMAALRDVGFVDPETKKSANSDHSVDSNKPTRAASHDDVDRSSNSNVLVDVKKGVVNAHIGKNATPAAVVRKEIAKSEITVQTEKSVKSESNINLKGILKRDNKEAADVQTPPQKPDRLSMFGGKEEGETTPSSALTSTPKDKTPHDSAQNAAAAVAARKKITVDLDASLDDRSLSPPPVENRKKISVDINFDFNASSTELPAPPKPKLTPPARPPPPRTNTSPGRMSAIELQKQLLDIDSKLSELELRGRHLEDSIRSVVAEEEDDLMVEWFQLVTEKNDLVRLETDLVYMSREQDLVSEQSQLESQLQYLLSKDESDKSFEEKQEEEYLIQRKLDIVNQRNSIIDSMDEDRLRYEEEDRDIQQMLQEKGFKGSPEAKQIVKAAKAKGKEPEKNLGSSKFYA